MLKLRAVAKPDKTPPSPEGKKKKNENMIEQNPNSLVPHVPPPFQLMMPLFGRNDKPSRGDIPSDKIIIPNRLYLITEVGSR